MDSPYFIQWKLEDVSRILERCNERKSDVKIMVGSCYLHGIIAGARGSKESTMYWIYVN
jgi:hypothetical protein